MDENNKKNDDDLKKEREKLNQLGVINTWDLLSRKKKEESNTKH